MENTQMKCIKGESCLYCGSTYCRFVDEVDQLKADNDSLKSELMQTNTYLEADKEIIKKLKKQHKADKGLIITNARLNHILLKELYNLKNENYKDNNPAIQAMEGSTYSEFDKCYEMQSILLRLETKLSEDKPSSDFEKCKIHDAWVAVKSMEEYLNLEDYKE